MLIVRWDGEVAREVSDELVEEEPLEIRSRARRSASRCARPATTSSGSRISSDGGRDP